MYRSAALHPKDLNASSHPARHTVFPQLPNISVRRRPARILRWAGYRSRCCYRGHRCCRVCRRQTRCLASGDQEQEKSGFGWISLQVQRGGCLRIESAAPTNSFAHDRWNGRCNRILDGSGREHHIKATENRTGARRASCVGGTSPGFYRRRTPIQPHRTMTCVYGPRGAASGFGHAYPRLQELIRLQACAFSTSESHDNDGSG